MRAIPLQAKQMLDSTLEINWRRSWDNEKKVNQIQAYGLLDWVNTLILKQEKPFLTINFPLLQPYSIQPWSFHLLLPFFVNLFSSCSGPGNNWIFGSNKIQV